MQTTIYNYFSEHHGVVIDENKSNFEHDYSAMSKNELKRQLKVLKSRITKPKEEIKCVSRILRKKFDRKKVSENCDHQSDYYKNFWKYCQKNLEPQEERINHCLLKMIVKIISRTFSPKKIVKNASYLHHGRKCLKIQPLTSILNHQLTLK